MLKSYTLIALMGLTLSAAPLTRADPASGTTQPACSFTAITDVQYADKFPIGPRHYRQSLPKLKAFGREITALNPAPAFIIHLGDLTDGRSDKKDCKKDLDTIMAAVKDIPLPWRFVLGNHDVNSGRDLFTQATGTRKFHYTFTEPKAPGWRFVVLDGNDAGYGVISSNQVSWLRETLTAARTKQERVICFCHYPLIKEASPRDHKLHNPQLVLDLLDQYPGVVVAWMTGHDHLGGYAQRNGVHHLTLQGTVESGEKAAYAVITLYPDHLSLAGHGPAPSRELKLLP